MNINRLTQKAQEAVIAARDLAEAGGQSEIGTLHLVKALLDQPGGVVPQLLERMGVDRAALDGAVRVHLDRLPRVAGGAEPGLSRVLRDTLVAAHDEIGAFGDQFVSTEHLLLALL